MLIHEKFVFLHLQKTGGTFLAKALKQELPSGSLQRGAPGKMHPGWSDIPAEARDRPVIFYVRNPWDWYVSYYHHLLDRRPDNGVFRRLMGSGGNDFGTVLRLALANTHDPYTARFCEFAGAGLQSDRLTIGRFESLLEDLEQFMSTAEVELPMGAMSRLRESQPINAATDRGHYRDYYDASLRDLVERSSRLLIERFDYRF